MKQRSCSVLQTNGKYMERTLSERITEATEWEKRARQKPRPCTTFSIHRHGCLIKVEQYVVAVERYHDGFYSTCVLDPTWKGCGDLGIVILRFKETE